MKKNFIVTTFVIILCTISVIYNLNKIKSNQVNTKETIDTCNYKYIIKDYKGRIAVYQYGKNLPIEIFDIYTDSLPETDSMKIYNGINITNEKELQNVIEDYTG